MPISDEKWAGPATKGDLAGLAILLSQVILQTNDMLEKINEKIEVDIHDELMAFMGTHREILDLFDELTGYRAE